MKTLTFALVTALLLAGCSAGSNSSSGTARSAPGLGAPVQSVPGAARPRNAPTANTLPARLALAQAIVYSADLTMQAGDVNAAAARAKQLVATAGGYVGNEDTISGPPSATITFQVPSARYAAVLDQLGSSRIGRRLSLQQRTQDVSQDVADTTSRVASAKATLASFRGLLKRATTVDQVIQVEQEIATREADLESLQARQRSLNGQTSFATVTLRVESAKARHAATGGFLGALASGWHAFTAFVGGIGMAFAAMLPFLIVAAVIGTLVRWLVRRRRRSTPSEAG